MQISPNSDVLTGSSLSPFSSHGRESANPFENFARHDAAADVLVVEDDADLSTLLCRELQAHGFSASAAFTGEQALATLAAKAFALVLLDSRLPGCSGIEVLGRIRIQDQRTPVFLMSGCDAIEDRIRAFENGADDYLVKPFANSELLARMCAALRRVRSGVTLWWRLGDLAVQVESRRVYSGSQEIALTPREFDVLLYLVRNRPTVVTREMLARDVWRVTCQSASLTNAIDVHVAHLRRKLDAIHPTKLIHTVRGKGFLAAEPSATQPAA